LELLHTRHLPDTQPIRDITLGVVITDKPSGQELSFIANYVEQITPANEQTDSVTLSTSN